MANKPGGFPSGVYIETKGVRSQLSPSALRLIEEKEYEERMRNQADCSKCKVHPTWEGDLCIHCHCSQRRSL